MTRSAARAIAVAMALVAGAVACSDDDGGAGGATPFSGTASTAAASTAATTAGATTTAAPADTATTAPAEAGSSAPAGGGGPPPTGPTGPGPGCEEGTWAVVGAFELATGAHQWSSCSSEQGYRTMLGTTDTEVFVALQTPAPSTTLLALDARSGAELWRAAAAAPRWGWPQGPFAASDIVVFRADEAGVPAVVGVDALTGAELWRLPGPEVGEPVANTPGVVVVDEGVRLRGLDRFTGQELWSSELAFQDLSGVVAARAATAVDGDMVIVPTSTGLVALNAPTGRERWRSQPYGHPTAGNRAVVATTETPGAFVTLEAATGIERFRATGAPSYGEIWAVGDGAVHVIDPQAGIVAYDLATGAVRWSRPLDERLYGQPQLVLGSRLILLWEAQLAVLETSTGSTWWLVDRPLATSWTNSVGANTGSVIVAANTLPFAD
jgi:outer membrane protein assembly factor BamB